MSDGKRRKMAGKRVLWKGLQCAHDNVKDETHGPRTPAENFCTSPNDENQTSAPAKYLPFHRISTPILLPMYISTRVSGITNSVRVSCSTVCTWVADNV